MAGGEVLHEADGRPTAAYQAYLHHQQLYDEAKRAYEDALAQARQDPRQLDSWPITGLAYQRAVDNAYDRWAALGHKNEIEAALARRNASGSCSS